MKNKYIAYYAYDNEFDFFETFEDAEKWLQEWDTDEGISEETKDGENYIAKITHKSSVNILETKKYYEDNNYKWPWPVELDWIGEVKYIKMEDDK